MKTKFLTAIVSCTILILLSECAVDKPPSMLHSSKDSTASTETVSVPTEEIQTVAQTAKTAEEKMPVQSAEAEKPAQMQPEPAKPMESPKEPEQPKPTEPTAPPATTEPALTEPPPPTETSAPAITEPPVEMQPKTAYDYEFDIDAIRADCIAIGQSMGYTLNSSLTPQNATWWNPVTASESNQGNSLRAALEQYIRFHTVVNLGAYGLDEIAEFNICCESQGGTYTIYFVFA